MGTPLFLLLFFALEFITELELRFAVFRKRLHRFVALPECLQRFGNLHKEICAFVNRLTQ